MKSSGCFVSFDISEKRKTKNKKQKTKKNQMMKQKPLYSPVTVWEMKVFFAEYILLKQLVTLDEPEVRTHLKKLPHNFSFPIQQIKLEKKKYQDVKFFFYWKKLRKFHQVSPPVTP